MEINRAQYQEAYQLGRMVFEGKLPRKVAAQKLESIGFKNSSGSMYVNGLQAMLKGQRYTRTLKASATDEYLQWIRRDYGEKGLRNAVSALRQHIEYYQGKRKGSTHRLNVILKKYTALLEEEPESFFFPEEISEPDKIFEGAVRKTSVNVYERSQIARMTCVDIFKCICSVCGFDFEKTYGEIGKNFIHVHHLRDLALIGANYVVSPKDDLRPVCPNCHAMLHKSKPAYSIDELKNLIKAQSRSH